jgi:hypothetical protein
LNTSAYFDAKIFAGHVLGDEVLDFRRGRPDVLQVHRLAVLAGAERVLGQVKI